MQKEKEKGKSHPFVGHLRPTEEVLWLSASTVMSLRNRLMRFGLLYIGVVVTLSIFFASAITPNNASEIFSVLIVVTSIVTALAIPTFIIFMLYHYSRRNRPPERAYAVTNERLLHRRKADVVAMPLEHVPTISLFNGQNGRGTLSFGAFFPMWSDMQDAAQLKTTIEQAQKRRVRDL
jgi:hypothetical protein